MELSPKQQTTSQIQRAKRVLILTHQNLDGDAIGSLIGLYLVLKKLNKEVVATIPEEMPKNFLFLPFASEIKKEIEGLREFVININCKEAEVDRLGYKVEGENLKIIITPKRGNFKKEDVSIEYGFFHFDLIIVLDTPDLERLGGIFEEHPHIFYQTPTINIDHHPTNTYFGRVNLVDLTATSTAEILISVIEALDKERKLFSPHVATCLLTGLISDTHSFQNANTTPKSLTCAAQLIAAGAQQQEIVKNLFQIRPISTLRLWGRILAKLKQDSRFRFAYTEVTKEDLEETEAKEEEISGVLDELLKSISSSDLVLLLSERKRGIVGSIRAIDRGVDCIEIAKQFGGGGHKAAAAFLVAGDTLDNVKKQVLEVIRNYQSKRVGVAQL